MSWTVAAFYRFVALSDLPRLQAELRALCASLEVCGTILLAPEGVNGTVAGTPEGIGRVLDELDRRCGIRLGEVKLSQAAQKPFARLRVRLRPEIITLRAPEADPSQRVGTYVEPGDWNALIADPDILLIDTRNAYETAVGTFEGAVDPKIASFTEFKNYVEAELDPARHRKVAMFCTGGIRCEKASAFMLAQGFESVFHLKGGILRYLEKVPASESRWQGECYVFDNRVAVGHGVAETDWNACHGCGHPLAAGAREHDAYEAGVSCPRCIDRLTDAKRAGLRMRHQQMTAARAATVTGAKTSS